MKESVNKMKQISEKEIKSLISLIDDEQVFPMVYPKLIRLGDRATPFIDEAIETSLDSNKTELLQTALDEIRLNHSINDLRNWAQNDSQNLFEALIIISKLRYPNMDLEGVNRTMTDIKNKLWLEINDNLTALEKIRVYNNIFHNVFRFAGDSEDFFNPENSFIVDVLKRRKGNPISLSCVYSIIAQSVGIPIYGVNMPKQFICVYTDKLYKYPYQEVDDRCILFYVNPFSNGDIYNLREVSTFLRRMHLKAGIKNLLPCDHITIINRVLDNIISIYKNTGNIRLEKRFTVLKSVIKDS